MRQLFPVQYTRELRLAWRGPVDALLPFGFFVAAAAMFPLGVGPEPHALRQLAPGLIWVCALLGTRLSLDALYTGDDTDDTLEQLVLTGHNGAIVAAARAAAHWTLTGLPLVLAALVFGLLFDLSGDALGTMALTLLLGTPVLSLLCSIGAALALGCAAPAFS